MNRPLASSLITFGSIDGWNFQSKLQRLLEWEARHHDAHRLMLLLLGLDLAGEHVVEEVGVTHVLLGRLLEHRAQLGRDAVEAQPLAVRAQALQLRCEMTR